ncbi:MAG TPA: nucleotidyltransferase domain-containing protein, partial [Nitrospirae bacterium]|nr:nucleotidyltransferase domain-containing protein [Nitrospirota bacterium]
MAAPDQTIRLIKEQFHYLFSEYGVEKIGLFGSIAKGTGTEDSDID